MHDVTDSAIGTDPTEEAMFERLAQLAIWSAKDKLPEISATERERFAQELIAPVQEWCRNHSDRVRLAHIVSHDNYPTVAVVAHVEGYDFTLRDPLAELEQELYRRGWRCFVLQLPTRAGEIDDLNLFSRDRIQVYGTPVGSNHADG